MLPQPGAMSEDMAYHFGQTGMTGRVTETVIIDFLRSHPVELFHEGEDLIGIK